MKDFSYKPIHIRARIGLLIPSVNTIAEADFHRIAPEGVEVHTNRVREGIFKGGKRVDAKTGSRAMQKILDDFLADVKRATADILHAEMNVIAYCATAGGFLLGKRGDRELVAAMNRVSKTPPKTTSSMAAVKALRALEITKVSVASTYPPQDNEALERFFESYGITVTGIEGIKNGSLSGRQMAELGPSAIYDFVEKVEKNARTTSEGIFISCANWRAVEVVESLERDLGKPVITTNQSTFWDCLRLADIQDKIDRYGELLKRF